MQTLKDWIQDELEHCKTSKKAAIFPETKSYWDGRIFSLQKARMYLVHEEAKESINE